jgi:hypothetical protein
MLNGAFSKAQRSAYTRHCNFRCLGTPAGQNHRFIILGVFQPRKVKIEKKMDNGHTPTNRFFIARPAAFFQQIKSQLSPNAQQTKQVNDNAIQYARRVSQIN